MLLPNIFTADTKLNAGDGNCAYRSVMFGLVEAAFCSSKVRKEISKRLAELNSIVPLWVLYHHVSRNCTSPAVDGYKLLKVGIVYVS